MTSEMGTVSRTCQCSDESMLHLLVENVVHTERSCTTLPVAAKYKSRIIALIVLITIAQQSNNTKRMSVPPLRLSAIFIFAHL